VADYKSAYEREKTVRKEAEKQLEDRSRDLYKANEQLDIHYQNLSSEFQKNALLLKIFRYSLNSQKLSDSLPGIISSMLTMGRLPMGFFDYYPLNRSRNPFRSNVYSNDEVTQHESIAALLNDNSINSIIDTISTEVISSHKIFYLSDFNKSLKDEELQFLKRLEIGGILALPVTANNHTAAIIYLILGYDEREIDDLIALFEASIKQLGILIEHRYSSEQLEQNYLHLRTMVDKLDATQKQLAHSEKMASIGQLSAGIAHEINNPMGYVKSNISSLKDYNDVFYEALLYAHKIAEISPNERSKPNHIYDEFKQFWQKSDIYYLLKDSRDLLKETANGIDRVVDIVSGLKSFAKASDKKWNLCNINDCLEEALKSSNCELKYKCRIKKYLRDIPSVIGSKGELIQVFLNLIINAGEALDSDGEIQLSTKKKDDGVEIRVSDNGSGIEKNNYLKIFEPFFTTKDVGQGTGLGLSISFGIIENHKGKIEVSSELGKGTCFSVWLPAV
jgi:signal transduction histidine kinase